MILKCNMVGNASKIPILKILKTKEHSICHKKIRNIDNAASGGVQQTNGPVALSLFQIFGRKVDVLSSSWIQDSAIFDTFSTILNFSIFSSIPQFGRKMFFQVFSKLNIKISEHPGNFASCFGFQDAFRQSRANTCCRNITNALYYSLFINEEPSQY